MCSAARVPWEGKQSGLLPKLREESSDYVLTFHVLERKSRIRETLYLSACADNNKDRKQFKKFNFQKIFLHKLNSRPNLVDKFFCNVTFCMTNFFFDWGCCMILKKKNIYIYIY